MKKTKFNIKIICGLVIMAMALSLVLCFSACTPSKNIINLQNYPNQITDEQLDGVDGIIADLESVKQNKDALEKYLTRKLGNILIPQKDESNVLAYQVIGFSQEGVELFPIYLFNDVDKSKIDYEELLIDDNVLLNERQLQMLTTKSNSSSAISIDMIYCAYAKNYVGKLNRVATIKNKLALYYFPLDNAAYDYYMGRYETTVYPTSKCKFDSIHISSMYHKDSSVDIYRTAFNSGIAPMPVWEIDTLMQYHDSYSNCYDRDMSVSVKENGAMVLNYDYTAYVEDMGVTNSYIIPCDVYQRYEDYYTYSYKFVPIEEGRAAKGRAYLGAYCCCYRINDNIDTIDIALSIDELSLTGQVSEPSLKSSFDNYYTVFISCDRDFNNSSISMEGSMQQETLLVTSVIVC